MASSRDRGWGTVAAIVIFVGYLLFPSGTVFEWTVAAISFLIGTSLGFFHKALLPWREVGNATLASCMCILVGITIRMSVNDFTLIDTLLLLREEKFVWGSLLPFGYWLLAGTMGYALVRYVRALVGKPHVQQ